MPCMSPWCPPTVSHLDYLQRMTPYWSPPSILGKSTATFQLYCQLSTLPQCRYRSKCIKVMLLSDMAKCIKHHEKIVWIFDFSILYPLKNSFILSLGAMLGRAPLNNYSNPPRLPVIPLQSSPGEGLFCRFCLLNSLCRPRIQCQCWIMKELLED